MWVLSFHYVMYILEIELRWSSLAGKHLYLLSCLSGLVCIEIELKQGQGGFPFKQVRLPALTIWVTFHPLLTSRIQWVHMSAGCG